MPENTSLIPTQTETATPTANAVVVEQKKNMSLKEKIVFSALGVAGVIGVIFLGKKVLKTDLPKLFPSKLKWLLRMTDGREQIPMLCAMSSCK
jgi:hypothetical protein